MDYRIVVQYATNVIGETLTAIVYRVKVSRDRHKGER